MGESKTKGGIDATNKEQIKQFWEWCGFWTETGQLWHFPEPEGHRFLFNLPKIDLNNLFKYAVPKVREKGCRTMLSDKTEGDVVMYMGRVYGRQTDGFLDAYDKESELALFCAIWKVIPKENKETE